MESFFCEVIAYFHHAPSPDARMVLFTDEEIHSRRLDVEKHLQLCAEYAAKFEVLVVSALTVHEKNLCLFLFGTDGKLLCRQPAIHLSMALRGQLEPASQVHVAHTALGNIALCVDVDTLHPQVARTAALKGADLLISIQYLDPVDDTPERLMCSVWNIAQSNNLYVINLSGNSCTVTCPAPLTRAQDGYLVRRTSVVPTRFGINLDRLDEVRAQFSLLENINGGLVRSHSDELKRW